jgi:hypothetical protein
MAPKFVLAFYVSTIALLGTTLVLTAVELGLGVASHAEILDTLSNGVENTTALKVISWSVSGFGTVAPGEGEGKCVATSSDLKRYNDGVGIFDATTIDAQVAPKIINVDGEQRVVTNIIYPETGTIAIEYYADNCTSGEGSARRLSERSPNMYGQYEEVVTNLKLRGTGVCTPQTNLLPGQGCQCNGGFAAEARDGGWGCLRHGRTGRTLGDWTVRDVSCSGSIAQSIRGFAIAPVDVVVCLPRICGRRVDLCGAIERENQCNNERWHFRDELSNPNDPLSGGRPTRCVWRGTQCIPDLPSASVFPPVPVECFESVAVSNAAHELSSYQ